MQIVCTQHILKCLTGQVKRLKKILSSNRRITEATYSCRDYPPRRIPTKGTDAWAQVFGVKQKTAVYGHDCVPKLTQMLLTNSYSIKCSKFPPIHPVSLCPLRRSRSCLCQLEFQERALSWHRPASREGANPALSTLAWRQGIVEVPQHSTSPEFMSLVTLGAGLTGKAEHS